MIVLCLFAFLSVPIPALTAQSRGGDALPTRAVHVFTRWSHEKVESWRPMGAFSTGSTIVALGAKESLVIDAGACFSGAGRPRLATEVSCIDAASGTVRWLLQRSDLHGVAWDRRTGVVFVDAMGGVGLLDIESGKERWLRELQGCSGLSVARVSDDGRMAVLSHTAGLVAVQLDDGRTVWESPSDLRPRSGASLASVGNTLVCVTDGQVIGLSPASGKPFWQRKAQELGGGGRLELSRTGAVLFAGETVVALVPETGRTRWVTRIPGRSVSSVVVGPEQVLCSCVEDGQGDASELSADELVSLDRATGSLLWRRSSPGTLLDRVGSLSAVLCGDSGLEGIDPRTGETVWRFRAPAPGCDAIPLASDQILCLSLMEQRLSLLAVKHVDRGCSIAASGETGGGSLVWSVDVSAIGAFRTPPVIQAGKATFVSSDRTPGAFSVATEDGRIRWATPPGSLPMSGSSGRLELRGPFPLSPARVFALDGAHLLVIDVDTGRARVRRFLTGARGFVTPVGGEMLGVLAPNGAVGLRAADSDVTNWFLPPGSIPSLGRLSLMRLDNDIVAVAAATDSESKDGRWLCRIDVTGKRVAWAQEIDGLITSSPAVLSGDDRVRIVVGTSDGNLLTFDARDGARGETWYVGRPARISSLFVADGGRLVAVIQDRELACIDTRGRKVAWHTEVDHDQFVRVEVDTKHCLVVNSARVFHVLDLVTGATTWRATLRDALPETAALSDDLVIVTTTSGRLAAFSVAPNAAGN